MAANDAEDIPAKDALILWATRALGAPQVRVVRIGENEREYLFSGGAAYSQWRDASDAERKLLIMITFHSMVVRDGISPSEAHKAFLAMPEYRAIIAADIDGAD